ncbi:hypothetical protein AB1Y20_003434 [Prymnesium parvum]|uniref:CobW C-terminal domain-containing protein n=1 Tax=Prymnesium parvum TaxID=97485 RepID=A0AB34JEX9_PRYPA
MALPVTVVGGFLGSGKTTLLNSLLSHEGSLRIGALVNELGSVDIDSSLLVSSGTISDGVVELANGCICCTINESLCDALTALLTQRDKLDCLLIETTGVADPGPVLQTLLLPQFASLLRVDGVLTVIDGYSMARRLSDESSHSREICPTPAGAARDVPQEDLVCFAQQLEAADILVINKTDLLSTPELHAVRAELRRRAPHARVLQCERGAVPLEVVLGEPAGPPRAGSGPPSVPFLPSVRNHLQRDGFRSVAFRRKAPLRLARFEFSRRTEPWSRVIRAKGFVYFEECPGYCMTLQLVGARLDVRVEKSEGAGETALVFIGQHLQEEALLKQLEGMEATDACDTCDACESTDVEEVNSGTGGEIADSNVDFASALTSTIPEAPTEGAKELAVFLNRDTRFELRWTRGPFVAFRLPDLLGASAEELNTELMQDMNTRSSGQYWLAPVRLASGELALMRPVDDKLDAKRCWSEIHRVTEQMMIKYLEGAFCGGCNCLEQLAGKALT